MQGMWVQSLAWEDSTCLCATTTESTHPRVLALQQEKPLQQEAQAGRQRAGPSAAATGRLHKAHRDPQQQEMHDF